MNEPDAPRPQDEESLRQFLFSPLRGALAWVAWLGWFYVLLFTVLAVWAAVMFFRATTVRDWILYATVFQAALLCAVATKIWQGMLAIRATILRRLTGLLR